MTMRLLSLLAELTIYKRTGSLLRRPSYGPRTPLPRAAGWFVFLERNRASVGRTTRQSAAPQKGRRVPLLGLIANLSKPAADLSSLERGRGLCSGKRCLRYIAACSVTTGRPGRHPVRKAVSVISANPVLLPFHRISSQCAISRRYSRGSAGDSGVAKQAIGAKAVKD